MKYWFSNNTCKSQCPLTGGYYEREVSTIEFQCLVCTVPGCRACPDDICAECFSPFYLHVSETLNRYCWSMCNETKGYFIVQNTSILECKKCTDRSCIFCPNDICLNCSKNMYKYLYEDHRCYPICNESNGHFATVRANDFYYCNNCTQPAC